MVGPVPGASGVFVAAGHEGSGLTLAPMSARILATQILRGCPVNDPSLQSIGQYLAPVATSQGA